MALAVDPRIEALLTAARGRVAAANAQRNQAGILAALGLTTSGLLERSSAVARPGQAAGFAEAPELQNVTYGLQQGPEGRAFRQGRSSIFGSAAQRGAGFSSATRNQNFDLTRELNNQVQLAMTNFDQQQNAGLVDQTRDMDSLASGIADIRFEQGQAEAERRRVEAAAAPAPTPGPGQPGGPPARPRFEIVRNPRQADIAGLRKRGYKRAGGPGNRFVLKY